MVITSLEEKQNRKIWVPIRGGNRGGWSLFNWEDVRDMPYKDREMYLGNSATIGVLDRGGKWRKRDWYLKTDKKYKSTELEAEHDEAVRKDYERMNAALGIADKQDEEKLNEQQMRELMKRIKMKKQDQEFGPSAPDAIGLGFDKTKVQIRSKPSAKVQNPHRLQAFDELSLQKSCKEETKEKKQKKEKKEKKEKKKKDKQRKHKHRQDSEEHSQKKKKKQKHHKRQKSQKDERRRDRSRSVQKHRKRRHSSSKSDSD